MTESMLRATLARQHELGVHSYATDCPSCPSRLPHHLGGQPEGHGGPFFEQAGREQQRADIQHADTLGGSELAYTSGASIFTRSADAQKFPRRILGRARGFALQAMLGATVGQQVRAVLAEKARAEHFYLEAESLGYNRREALLVLYGVMSVCRELSTATDPIAIARKLLASGELPTE